MALSDLSCCFTDLFNKSSFSRPTTVCGNFASHRKCSSPWGAPSFIMPIASRSTAPSVPATPKSPKSWRKVKPGRKPENEAVFQLCVVSKTQLSRLYLLFVSCFFSSSKNRLRFQGLLGREKPQAAAFIHSGVVPDQTHPESSEVPSAAEGALLPHGP